MCDPVSIGLITAGTAASAYSAAKQTEAQNQANEYNAQIMERNAAYAEVQAADSEKRGATEAAGYQTKVRSAMGEQKSILAKAGVALGAGTAQDIVSSSYSVGEMDAMKIKANAAREAYGFRAQAEEFRGMADMKRKQYVSPFESAGVSLLTSAGGLAQRFSGGK